MFTLSRARTWCALVISLSLSGLTQAAFTQLISFGDSLSDRGNVFTASVFTNPPPPYAAGQFSNGTVWTGLLATQLGVSSTPSLIGGTNYAWGGARTNDGNLVPQSTRLQVDEYLDPAGLNADSNALYTIWSGGNDVNDSLVAIGAAFTDAETLFPGTGPAAAFVEFGIQSTILAGFAADIAQMAQDLIDEGAQDILINNLPNLGLTPAADGNEGTASNLTSVFNNALASALTGVIGGNLILLDAFTLTNDIVTNPGDYNLTNVDDNCLATVYAGPGTCDGHLFWDDLHPTAVAQILIADAAYAQVIPVPAALPLMLSALMGLGVIKRARKA